MNRSALLTEPATVTDEMAGVRQDFPVLRTQVNGKPLVYLDNAATSQKPVAVLDALSRFYREENANIHRGVHHLSERASDAYESARGQIGSFLGASQGYTLIFTRGSTEAINLVAHSFGGSQLKAGDEVLVSEMEHHSNIVPWQQVCRSTGAVLRVIPVSQGGVLDLGAYERSLSGRTRIVAVTHVSNAIGTVNPVRRITALAHAAGAVVIVDGAQSAPHLSVDVRETGCDFFVCSGHKMLGPTGIGVLIGRDKILQDMPPYQTGGGMIARVSFQETTFAGIPGRFEAGTPPIAQAVGFAAAIGYMQGIGIERIGSYESMLLTCATERLREAPGVRLVGAESDERASVLSFVVEGVHPHDVGTILNQEGIAVRTGHHCAQPLMEKMGVPGTVRASFSFYNTVAEIDALINGLRKVQEVFN